MKPTSLCPMKCKLEASWKCLTWSPSIHIPLPYRVMHKYFLFFFFSCKFYTILFIYLFMFYFTILYWFCHTSAWIRHRCTCVPHPEPPFHLPPCTIPLGHPRALAQSILYPASNLDLWLVSYMILYMFQCHSPKSSHPLPLPQSPKEIFFKWYLPRRKIFLLRKPRLSLFSSGSSELFVST